LNSNETDAVVQAPDRVRLDVKEARLLATRAIQSIGYNVEDAGIIAEHVLDAALCGYEYSGLAKILNIEDNPRFRSPRSPVSAMRETSVSVLYDGGNNVGMLAMYRATQAAIAKAAQHGFAIVGMTNTWNSGRSAHYVEMIARAGLVAIHTVSSSHAVAPPGGAKATLGTNPIAFGFPRDPDPLIIDMGTSAFMGTDLNYRKRIGAQLPEGVAIDAAGRPTRDPGMALLGAILPFGGHKGFALSLAIEALGVLGGSGSDVEKKYGYLIIAIKPDLLVPLEEYKRDLHGVIERIKATPLLEGCAEIRIPSERMYRERERNLEEGIVIDARIHEALKSLAQRGSLR